MSRFLTAIVALGVVAALFATPIQRAAAQTPAQMEYERQQREYRQQQEQQRQEQQRLQQLQNENARRQQEESNRAMRSSIPGSSPPQSSTTASPPSNAPAAGGRPAQSTGTSERRYAIPGHGTFVVQVPRDWKEQVRQTPNQPPTIVLGPAAGSAFQVLLTPSWPEPKGRTPDTRDQLRAAVGRGAQSAKSWAAESEPAVRELQGRSGPGFYFSVTERAPKPGTHKFVTTGILRVGELSVPFTITSGDGHASIVQQALEVLKSGAQEPAGAAAAASRPAPSSGPSAAGPTAAASTGAIRMNSYYICNGERVAVLRCRSEADDAYCSVQYPDRKSAATGGMTPELAEKRGELVKKLEKCQG